MNRSASAFPLTRFAQFLMAMMISTLLAACGGGGGKVGLPTGVALFTNAPTSVTLAVGANSSYTIGGGNPTYSASSSNRDVATVTASGTGFTITAVAAGTAIISVTDAVGASVNVPVTVSGTTAPTALFSTAPSAVTLAVGATGAYAISGGRQAYTVVSSNAGVARVALTGTNFVVTALAAGTAQVVITDAAGATLNVDVTVTDNTPQTPLFTTAPAAIALTQGATALYAISGGQAPYAVTSSAPGVARVALSGNDFVITGVSGGTAQLQITDARGTAITLAVTVGSSSAADLFTTAPATVSVGIGATAAYRIGGGVPAYEVSSSDGAVARVAVNGSDFIITGVSAGSAQIQLTDATGSSKSVAVTVGAGGAATALFTSAPAAISVLPGASASFAVGGGRAPYAVSSSDSAVVRVTLSGATYTVTGVAAGSAQVRVSDADGTALTVTATVGTPDNAPDLFTTAPAAVNVGVGAVASFSIGGGRPAYAVSSSDLAVARVALSGNDYAITGVGNGTAQVRIIDSAGTALLVTVTTGAGATPFFTTAPGAVSVGVGATAAFRVGGGSPAYTAASSNAAVARVQLLGNDLVVTGVTNGLASITVADAVGATETIAVTVGSGTGGTAFYTTAPDSVIIAAATNATFLLGGGTPAYTASSSNTSVARVTLGGGTLFITGMSVGSATIVVGDAAGARKEISVTIPDARALYTTAPQSLTITSPSAHNFAIGGGVTPYSAASSNTGVVNANVSGTVLTISGTGTGSAQVVITDAAGSTLTIAVTVAPTTAPALTVSPASATGNVGDTLTFQVGGGQGSFSATSNNPSIATVSTAGTTFSAVLLNVGTTSVTVVDALGQTLIVPITVEQVATTLRLSPSALQVAENSVDTITLNIFGGTGPYRAFTGDQTLSSVSIVGSTMLVAVGSNTNRCVNTYDSSGVYVPNGIFDVTLTVLDSLGASATAILSIKDNGAGVGAGCP